MGVARLNKSGGKVVPYCGASLRLATMRLGKRKNRFGDTENSAGIAAARVDLSSFNHKIDQPADLLRCLSFLNFKGELNIGAGTVYGQT